MPTGRATPNPRLCPMIELLGGEDGHLVNLLPVGKGLAGQGLTAVEAPSTFPEIEPAGTFRDEDLVNPRVSV